MFVQQNAADQVDERAVNFKHDGSQLAGFDLPGKVVVFGSPKRDEDVRRAAFRAFVSAAVPAKRSARRHRARSAALHNLFVGMLMRLALRPSLIVAEGFGALVVLSCLYRCASRRATLLVYLAEPPKPLRLKERLILQMADGVLVDGNAAELALSGLTHAVYRIAPAHALGHFLRITPTRSPQQARRIIVVSDLTPGSGASDLLVAVTA